MLKHASMFEYAPSPLGCSLRIFEAWGLAVHYLNCYLSPKILFKQELSFDVCDIRASIQCNIESCYILSHVRSDLMGINQCLTSLTGIVCRFEMQQKIGAQLMPEQWFQIIILGLKPGSSFFCQEGFCISGLLVGVIDLHKVKVVLQRCQEVFHRVTISCAPKRLRWSHLNSLG